MTSKTHALLDAPGQLWPFRAARRSHDGVGVKPMIDEGAFAVPVKDKATGNSAPTQMCKVEGSSSVTPACALRSSSPCARARPPHNPALGWRAAILSRPIRLSRHSALKPGEVSVSRPIGVVVLKDHVTETKMVLPPPRVVLDRDGLHRPSSLASRHASLQPRFHGLDAG